MPDLTPEQRAREKIDAQLSASSWIVQGFQGRRFLRGRGIALQEIPLITGPPITLLLVDRKAPPPPEAVATEIIGRGNQLLRLLPEQMSDLDLSVLRGDSRNRLLPFITHLLKRQRKMSLAVETELPAVSFFGRLLSKR